MQCNKRKKKTAENNKIALSRTTSGEHNAAKLKLETKSLQLIWKIDAFARQRRIIGSALRSRAAHLKYFSFAKFKC